MIGLRPGRHCGVAYGVALWCLLSPVLEAAAPRHTAAQTSKSTPSILRGQEYYDQSRFDEAIGLLKDLEERGALTGPDLQLAREILARSYVKKGYPVQARAMFKKILADNHDYRPDAIRVPPDEMAVFEGAKKEFDEGQAAPPPPTGTAEPKGPPPVTSAEPEKEEPKVAPLMIPAASSAKKPLFKRWYFWAGLAALGGGAALALGGGGDDGPKPDPILPGFPAHP